MSGGLSSIEHIVVLMLENRSFDNILGKTFEPDVERSNSFYVKKFEIPVPAFTIGGRNILTASIPTPDPGEVFQFMNQQIFGLREPLPVNSPSPEDYGPLGAMGGFVQNYLTVLEEGHYPKALLATIMHLFEESQVPVSVALGKAFAVVDTYHASAPCQTLPNRCFAELGTAQGYVNNNSYDGSYASKRSNAPYFGTTIFNQINDTDGIDWRVYFGDFPLTLLMANTWLDLFEDRFHFFDQFAKDVEAGALPAYSWIEPAYQLFATDNHPPHDINLGEYLLQEVYNTLRAKPDLFEKTLLVVTYDEHGGCYDHVLPTSATPDGHNPLFSFDRYGVRVPTLLISPQIAAGTVGTPGYDPGTGPVYDHTSILATVRTTLRVKGDPLSPREAAAKDLGRFLTLPPSELNYGPDSVSVGISKKELEIQAAEETLSELAQFWWENQHSVPQSRQEAEAALEEGAAAASAAPFETARGKRPSDSEIIQEITDFIRKLFGRAPTGLLTYG